MIRAVRMPTGRLARSSMATGAVLALRVATQAATLLLLVRLFAPDIYGQLAAAATLAVVLGILPSFGAGLVLMARVPRDPAAATDVWRYAWPMIALSGTLLLAIYLPLAMVVGGVGSLPLSVLVWLGIAELLFTPFTALLSFALQGNGRVPLSQVVQWMPLGLRVLATLPCFALPDTQRLQAYAMLQCLAALLGLLAGYWITRRHVMLNWRPRYPTRAELRDGAAYAGMHVVASNSSEFDKILAVRAVGAHDAGLYNATARVVVALVMPVLALLLAAQPRLFHHAHAPSTQGLRLVRLIALLSAGWGVASGLLLAACSPLLPYLFGRDYAEAAQLMPWMAFVAPLISLRFAAGTVLVALGRPLDRVVFEIGGVFVLAVSMLMLAAEWGLPGVIAAVVLSEAGMSGAGWWMVRQHLRARRPV